MASDFDFDDPMEPKLSSLDYWRLCDDLTVIQSALLVAGHDPSSDQEYIEGWVIQKRPPGYEGAKAAIKRALIRNTIEGEVVPESEYDINGNFIEYISNSIDVSKSLVDVSSLKNWLRQRGIKTGFFFPANDDSPDYLDPAHPRYSQKLAATVTAWYSMEDSELQKGKTAKQALERWLRENAPQYGLSDEDGKPNEKGIEECAKVANWQIKGGAPKTPG